MAEQIFPSKIAVHRWLIDNEWKISRSQFYDHCKDKLLRPAKKDGKYHLRAVKKYASLHVARTDTGMKVNDKLDKMHEEKAEVELEREKVKLEKDQHDLNTKKNKYILRTDFEQAIVARAVTFMAHLNHSVQSNIGDWIELVDGDQEKASLLVDAISEKVGQRMGDFATDAEYDVILEVN